MGVAGLAEGEVHVIAVKRDYLNEGRCLKAKKKLLKVGVGYKAV